MYLKCRRASAAVALFVIVSSPSLAQSVAAPISKYWCDKLGGLISDSTCMVDYVPQPGACDVFAAANVDDPEMTAILNEVKAAEVCLASRVDEAKVNSVKLRANVMGYVTAGNPELEDQLDPIQGNLPDSGKASYWPAVSYFLYQCVVETCTSK